MLCCVVLCCAVLCVPTTHQTEGPGPGAYSYQRDLEKPDSHESLSKRGYGGLASRVSAHSLTPCDTRRIIVLVQAGAHPCLSLGVPTCALLLCPVLPHKLGSSCSRAAPPQEPVFSPVAVLCWCVALPHLPLRIKLVWRDLLVQHTRWYEGPGPSFNPPAPGQYEPGPSRSLSAGHPSTSTSRLFKPCNEYVPPERRYGLPGPGAYNVCLSLSPQ